MTLFRKISGGTIGGATHAWKRLAWFKILLCKIATSTLHNLFLSSWIADMDYYELCVTLNKVDLAPQVWDQEALESQVASLGVVAIRLGLTLHRG